MRRGSYIEQPMKARLPDFGLAHKTRATRDALHELGYRLNRGTEFAWLVYDERDGKLHARLDTLTQLDLWIQTQRKKNG